MHAARRHRPGPGYATLAALAALALQSQWYAPPLAIAWCHPAFGPARTAPAAPPPARADGGDGGTGPGGVRW